MANRYICTVLDEMRECTKTLNFSYLIGLIEEAQTLANRMEAGLQDKGDINYYYEKIIDLKKESKELQKEILELKKDLNELS